MSTTDNLLSKPAVTPPLGHDTAHRVIPELDGVRGIAVILVMLCHCVSTSPVPAIAQQLYLNRILFLGWSGVDLFFVLSGFLITGILLDTKESKNYFTSFYARRVLRIFPLYLLSVFAYFHIAVPLAHSAGGWMWTDSSIETWFWIHLSNWPIAFGKPAHWLSHFWSLSIEEQFYLFWPVMVFFLGRRTLPIVCLGLAAASFGLRCVYADNDFGDLFLYTFTPFRIEPLALGSLGAILIRNPRTFQALKNSRYLRCIAAAGFVILIAVVAAGRTTSFTAAPMATFGFTSFALLYFALVLYADMNSGSSAWLASFLRDPVLRKFGKYSYAIYVFHFPIFLWYGTVAPKFLVRLPEVSRFLCWLLALAGEIGLAYGAGFLSWHLIEKHFLALKTRFEARA